MMRLEEYNHILVLLSKNKQPNLNKFRKEAKTNDVELIDKNNKLPIYNFMIWVSFQNAN